MSEALWYFDKAAECGRRAEQATDPTVRAGHLRDQSNWQQIAKRIEVEEALKIQK
jgi:hypothetical protein